MEVNDRPTRLDADPPTMSSDQPSQSTAVLAADASREVAEPIIVAQHAVAVARTRSPTAAACPRRSPTSREHELMEKGDNGRWGALDVIPTKADYVLDLPPPQQPLAAARRASPAARWR